MVLGHLSATAAGWDILRRLGRPLKWFSLPLVLVGAYLPDLVDKPLNRLTGLSGRGYGHSLVVQAAVFGLLFLLLPKHRRGTRSIAFGAALHLLEDAVPPEILLAPLLGPVPPAPQWSFFESLRHFYEGGGPLVWIECLSIGYWIVVEVRLIFGPTPALKTSPAKGG